MDFNLKAPFIPTGDQPDAIQKIVEGLHKGYRDQVILGATGTGKTFTMANIIQQMQMPALIMAHNKTLAAQLSPITPSSILSLITIITSQKHMFPAMICISKKKPRSMKKLTACVWPQPRL